MLCFSSDSCPEYVDSFWIFDFANHNLKLERNSYLREFLSFNRKSAQHETDQSFGGGCSTGIFRGEPPVAAALGGLLAICFLWPLLERSDHDRFLRAFDNSLQFFLLLMRHFKPIQRLLKVTHKGLPLLLGDHEMAM